MICWKCKESCEHALCISCGALQPPPSNPNPFDVLRLPQRYFLETNEIEQAYRKVSRQVHPDRFVTASAVIRRMALQWMAAINTSREVVLSPTKRARWLATGTAVPEEEKMSHDMEFLEHVFELQAMSTESPEEAQAAAQRLIERLETKIAESFHAHEKEEGSLDMVVEMLDKLQYLNKMRI